MQTDDTDVPDGDSIRLARAELARWCEHACAALTCGEPVWNTVCAHIPARLQRRLGRALEGCTTEFDVRMVFASVQEQQLCS